jgi:hypothetical protein
MAEANSSLSRYSLPGYGLPLNFTLRDSYTTSGYYGNLGKFVKTYHPALGEWGPLFPNALDCDRPCVLDLRSRNSFEADSCFQTEAHDVERVYNDASHEHVDG